MSLSRQQLALYQSQLLELLDSGESVYDIQIAISKLARKFGGMRETSEPDTSEPDVRMTDVAMKLTKKWGVRRNP